MALHSKELHSKELHPKKLIMKCQNKDIYLHKKDSKLFMN